jgi:hypothetical protein
MVSDETIDENIYDLVKALNEIRYVETFDSCEMHEDAEDWNEHWYVGFDLPADKHGWDTLDFLAWVIDEYFGSGDPPSIIVWWDVCVHFELQGTDKDDLKELPKRIRKMVQKHRIPTKNQL